LLFWLLIPVVLIISVTILSDFNCSIQRKYPFPGIIALARRIALWWEDVPVDVEGSPLGWLGQSGLPIGGI
jgi:hypothetical protein